MSEVVTGAKARTHAQLLDATRDELAETGELRPDRVAARAGWSTAAFYKHFATKNDALAEAFARTLERQVNDGLATLSLETLIEHGLERVVEDLYFTLVRYQRRELNLFRAGMAAVPNSDAVRTVLQHWEQQFLDGLIRFAELGQRAGYLLEGDSHDLALAWLVLAQGWYNHHLFGLSEDSHVERYLVSATVCMLRPAEHPSDSCEPAGG